MSEECKQEQQEQQEQPTMKYAKSMTGHLYSYAVQTAGEFLSHVSTECSISMIWLHLFDPTVESEDQSDGTLHANSPLQDHIIYSIFMDSPTPQLLPWIDPEILNPHMRMENPSYILTEEEATQLAPSQLDYLAMYTTYMDAFETQLHRLSDNGWKRLFANVNAVPLLEKYYQETKRHFNEYEYYLAMNTHAIPLITRLLEDKAPMKRPDRFWRNLSKNEGAMSLLEQYPEERNRHFLHLSENPSSIPFIQSYLKEHPDAVSQFHWGQLSGMPEAMPLLFQYPQMVYRPAIMYNPHPEVITWIRMHMCPEKVEWRAFCSYTGEERIQYIEEHLEYVTEEGWKSLCHSNPEAIPLLKQYPEKIHWSLLCCNPSPDVIPMIEAFVATYEEEGFAPFVSEEMVSLLGFSLTQHHIRESYRGKDLWHEDFKHVINLGALSLHPHALPLLEKRSDWIYSNSFSVRPDIYQMPTGTLL